MKPKVLQSDGANRRSCFCQRRIDGRLLGAMILLNNEDAPNLLKRLSKDGREIQIPKMDSKTSAVMGNNDFYGSSFSNFLVWF
jgi:hypothetical protein